MYILEELWLGNISPIEDAISQDASYHHALQQVIEQQQALKKWIPQERKDILFDYFDAETQLQGVAERVAFVQGVRIGAKLLLDILT